MQKEKKGDMETAASPLAAFIRLMKCLTRRWRKAFTVQPLCGRRASQLTLAVTLGRSIREIHSRPFSRLRGG